MISIAILGFGTVGSGVAAALQENSAQIAAAAGEEIRLKYIVDVRDFPDSPFASLVTKDFSLVENDPEVRVVVETIGGRGVARDFTRRALAAGKHVVTSNKELVSEDGRELLELAREKGVNYFFEASVGGGIPILRPLFSDLRANKILSIKGILNGTTNYILSSMREQKTELAVALKEAQAKGYAEANPDSDINGTDACRKISILSDLAWGKEISPSAVYTEGIGNVLLQDIETVGGFGGKIKLIGQARCSEDGTVTCWVAPQVVLPTSMLYHVDYAYNAVLVRGNALGDTMFYGSGAGSLPTASAVLGDVIDAVLHSDKRRDIGWSAGGVKMGDPAEIQSRWYVRTGKTWQLIGPCSAADVAEYEAKYRICD